MKHPIVSESEWFAARRHHLLREKDLLRQLDELRQQRRELPWVRVTKPYVFTGPKGEETLADLFGECSQLIIQHFMFAPDWVEGCVGCSFQADHVDSSFVHLRHHDVAFAAVSRAPYVKIDAFRRRMGWQFHWVSSQGSDFNFDFGVSFTAEDLARGAVSYNFETRELDSEEMPGVSVFYRDETGAIFRTYSAYGRSAEHLTGAYNYLDMAPKGRNETGPAFDLTDWVRHHDRYESTAPHSRCGRRGSGER
ncbi:putative dithiol-disulfide oxidoreductase (DUF899 family) [Povalibacter uvarum]|uniref:Putative dithiol-disulfide oxidoreductase (DUF899 family) n=2 Tax=Povalibacter uvarum TaxID=732238 RepID=A0A841HRT8_9GAMM|nr:thioredoxin family protein [Povalibacter uvarum]MBB6096071.1 putative dithiol-disulfide oxidoreductase (DUF899 family) [Povalibacter uvarum]